MDNALIEFKNLLRLAIGDRTQKDFAEIAGLSAYNVTRMLKQTTMKRPPRRDTLKKIAASSEGRVTEEQLLSVCGYVEGQEPISIESDNDRLIKEATPQAFADAYSLKDGLLAMAGCATNYKSLEDFFDTVLMLYCPAKVRVTPQILEEVEFNGRGHRNAEMMAHCIFFWRNGFQVICKLYFTVFYCQTAKGGFIVSDVATDLTTLLEVEHSGAGMHLFHLLTKKDVNCEDYPVALDISVDRSAELRLLKAIFGDTTPEQKEGEK